VACRLPGCRVARTRGSASLSDWLWSINPGTTLSVIHGTERIGSSLRVTAPRHPAALLQRAVIALAAMVSFVACDRGGGRGGKGDRDGSEALAATPSRASQGIPYTPRELDAIGQVRGAVQLDGPPPADSVIQPTSDSTVCGSGYTRPGIEHPGGFAAGVVVWIEGLRSGKPLPIERRFDITNDRCTLVPEVQAVIAGGTLNVRSLDAVEHQTRIVHRDGNEVLATIRETDEGQVVPNERVLARPGILELACDVHVWTRAWIAVFDHPYFAVSGPDGSFVMDSLPPGTYQIRAWHPRLGPISDSITVTAGQATQISLKARAK